jgi:tRNA (guanine-N1)-methyltransferase
MKITVLTLFPEILRGFFESSIMAKAVERGLMSFELVNIRDYATDKHHKCDDEVFGGGAGMLMLPGPLGRALDAAGVARRDGSSSEAAPASPGATPKRKRAIFVTPSGRLFNEAMAHDFSREEELVIVCGHYEGVDQRVVDRYVTDEVSIGDYVLSSGEVAALVLVDAIYRLVPGVIKGESLFEESFSPRAKAAKGEVSGPLEVADATEAGLRPAAAGPTLLEYPQYTRPAIYDNLEVPEVLTSGHHANIVRWRLRESLKKTLAYRPELLAVEGLPPEVRKLLREILTEGGEDEPHTEDSGAAD